MTEPHTEGVKMNQMSNGNSSAFIPEISYIPGHEKGHSWKVTMSVSLHSGASEKLVIGSNCQTVLGNSNTVSCTLYVFALINKVPI